MEKTDCPLLQYAYEEISAFFSSEVSSASNHYGIAYACLICAVIVLLTFVVSELTNNYSQTDKLWSITPVIFCWCLVVDGRTLIMAIVVSIWGIRLTWNFHRRGGYAWPPWSGDEDYRWKNLQNGFMIPFLKNPIIWHLFNLFFISFYQNFLLLLITTPSMVAYTVVVFCGSSLPLQLLDYIATILILSLIVIETIADNQQYKFQTEKYQLINNSKATSLTGDYADGFCQSGLFAIVRKPNYAAEQSIWICFYLYSIAAANNYYLNYSMVGWILLCLLFQGSAWFTEGVSLSKYPAYREYMKQVPLFVPNPFMLFNGRNRNNGYSTIS